MVEKTCDIIHRSFHGAGVDNCYKSNHLTTRKTMWYSNVTWNFLEFHILARYAKFGNHLFLGLILRISQLLAGCGLSQYITGAAINRLDTKCCVHALPLFLSNRLISIPVLAYHNKYQRRSLQCHNVALIFKIFYSIWTINIILRYLWIPKFK